MRILWITPGFAANEQDHNCIPPLQLLARTLLKHGVDLHIIALEYPFSGKPYKWPDATSPDNSAPALATIYPCNGQNRSWLRWRTFFRARQFAKQVFSDKKVDAMHSFWLGPAWGLGKQLEAIYSVPHWTTLMGQDVLPENRYLKRLKPFDTSKLVALTAFHNKELEKSAGLKTGHIVPWGIADQDKPIALPEKRPIDVLGVGSLIPVKNWGHWFRVLHLTVQQKPNLRATLIGAGPQKKQLQALSKQLGLEKALSITGGLPRSIVLAHMRESNVLLHTARFESFGYVFVEAAANGCRIVSTAVGLAPEIGQCGATAPELSEALIKALKKPFRKTPDVPYSMEKTAQAYLKLYAPES